MNFTTIAKIGGMLALTIGLAGCVDLTEDIKITSATNATATVTTVMSKDIYPMIKAGAAGEDAEPFCENEGETLTENADGSATCVLISEGAFADLDFGEDDSTGKPTFTANPDGTVRVSVKSEGLIGDLGGADQDEQTKAMIQQMFDGHFLVLRFGGSEIVETNMEDVGDGYAEKKMAFLDLINGTIELPEEIYAVVRP